MNKKSIILFILLLSCLFLIDRFSFSQDSLVWRPVGEHSLNMEKVRELRLHYNDSVDPCLLIVYTDNTDRPAVLRFDDERARWLPVGDLSVFQGKAENISVAYNPSNQEQIYYLGFKDKGKNDKITVLQCDKKKNTWEIFDEKGFQAGKPEEFKMFIDNIYPVIAFTDADDGKKPAVWEYVNTEWMRYQNGKDDVISDDKAYALSFTSSRGVRYLGFSDNDCALKASVMYFDLKWKPVGNKGFSPGRVNDWAIGVSYNRRKKIERVVAAFQDTTEKKKLTVMYNDNNSPAWQLLGDKGFTSGPVSSLSLCMYRHIPFVAFADGAKEGAVTVMYYLNERWQVLGEAGFSKSGARNINLAIGNDTAYVGYITTTREKKVIVSKINIKDLF
jgi:hypothetical protein